MRTLGLSSLQLLHAAVFSLLSRLSYETRKASKGKTRVCLSANKNANYTMCKLEFSKDFVGIDIRYRDLAYTEYKQVHKTTAAEILSGCRRL